MTPATKSSRDHKGAVPNAIFLLLFLSLTATLAGQPNPTQQGLEHFHRGDYRAAAKSFRAALAASDAPLPRVYLALSRAATGECSTVAAELRTQFDTVADSGLKRTAGVGYLQCALAADDFASAYPVLTALRAAFPADPDVLYLAARFYRKGWNDVMYDLFQKAPASYRVNQLSGEIFETQGRAEEAASEYRKAIAKNPAALDLHFRLGRMLAVTSNTPESLEAARKEFEAELRLNPGDAVSHYQIGQILLTEQKPAEAASRFEKALALKPDFVEALIALGKYRSTEKQHTEAIRLLERAVELRPRSEPALYNLMLAYRNGGRTTDARAASEKLKKLQQPPQGEFTEFLKKLGEKPPAP